MTQISGGPAPSPQDLEAADRVRALQTTELERVREQASKWRDGLLGLAALFGTVVVFKGRDSLDGLAPWVEWSAAGALLAALVAVIVSAFHAMIAAFGWTSQPMPVGTSNGLHERLLRDDRLRAREAIRRIKIASVLMIAGITAMALATSLALFGPEEAKKDEKQCVSVVTADDTVSLTVPLAKGRPVTLSGPGSLEVGPC
ncbi:hypothetical protein OG453_19450 [Streptomyces sp. NBC_01381]|uniref:hypothetical protein n=1 Tax=Streptomyces sp. NBC_01381 TaxID=2903845 RepID=UPI0022503C0F|nr:hypothetical protein [Streptomyces sp. NBC_01381]MCX4668823.1 hypothetical protein [Streptomyces sp. NBC_01381]